MIAGNNAITIRENNIALIIRLINKAKICSRADLAIQTGLKQATITYIINDLIKWGLVEETGSIEGRLKRRSIGITLNSKTYRIIGIRLNRHYMVVGSFSINGELIVKREMKLDKHIEPEEVMKYIKTFVHELINSSVGTKILGIGMAIPGPFIPGEGKIALMSGSPGWESVRIEDELHEEFTLPVFLEHDANCGVLAEFWYGDVDDAKDILYVAADVGIGAGILIDGQLYRGKLGTAGEIGHMSIDYNGPKCECGNRGCLELYCSTKKLMQEYREEVNNCTLEEILHAVADGDPAARKVYAKIATFLGLGLVSLINILNPELIILSDTLSLGGKYLTEVISDTMQRNLLDAMYKSIKIKLGTHFAGETMLFGASAVVLENLLLQPSVYFKPVG